MEGLIIAALIAIFGAIANKAKRPDDSGGDLTETKKRIGDYAKGFFEEATKDFNRDDLPPGAKKFLDNSRETISEQQPMKTERRRPPRQVQQRKTSGDLSDDRRDLTKQELFPLEADDVRKGIILAEILAKPKARR
ncbi:hypothetical protein [Indiicoccus explosivorum]|uniref:hypothetical protein n=1 Tax=Indiicoccus explosivorum TaxID=1917864 RepID=UPI000B4368CC|nr:hypothetical protein [Indiicoccus explosivorum]